MTERNHRRARSGSRRWIAAALLLSAGAALAAPSVWGAPDQSGPAAPAGQGAAAHPHEPTGAAAAVAAGMASTPNQVTGHEITEGQRRAVEHGLQFLASQQAKDGGYSGEGLAGPRHAGITALAALAFMEAGNLPNRGKYGQQVQKCLDFVLSCEQQNGLICADMSQGPMYGHGFATLFLGEVYGMSPNEEVKEKLQKAVQLIEKTQNSEGGWRYQPAPYDADISVTICQVMALRAARDAGIKVEKEVVDKSIAYVKSCQNTDGGFCYQAQMHGTGSGYARTAAGVAALYYSGIFQGDEIARGLKYLKQNGPGKSNAQSVEGMYFYANYYGCQAMFLAGGEFWASYYPAIRDELIQRQDKQTGAWQGEAGEDYGTAMALIILQVPNRYLPVFAGKGPGS